jgi:hypothetical protein
VNFQELGARVVALEALGGAADLRRVPPAVSAACGNNGEHTDPPSTIDSLHDPAPIEKRIFDLALDAAALRHSDLQLSFTGPYVRRNVRRFVRYFAQK